MPQPGWPGPPLYDYGLGGWVCSLGPPLLLIIPAWVGGHRAISKKIHNSVYICSLSYIVSVTVSDPMVRVLPLQMNDADSNTTGIICKTSTGVVNRI